MLIMSNQPTLSLQLDTKSCKSKSHVNCFFPIRYYIAFLGFLSSAAMFAVRCNLSVAIVAMVNSEDNFTISMNQTNNSETSELKVEPFNKVNKVESASLVSKLNGAIYGD